MKLRLPQFLADLSARFQSRLRPRGRRSRGRGACFGLAAEILEDRRLLATLTVNTLDDGVTPNSELSLREAIELVNSGGMFPPLTVQEMNQIDTTEAFGVNDTIRFNALLAGGTIALSTPTSGNTRLEIFRDLVIEGLGANQLTIDAEGKSQVFFIGNAMTSINVSIDGLRLFRGHAVGVDTQVTMGAVLDTTSGGAIFSHQTNLTISNSRITSNTANRHAGGIYLDGGMLTLNNTEVSFNRSDDNGGSLFIDGDASLQGSTVVGNDTLLNGAGLYVNSGSTMISNTSLSDNDAVFGGAIYNNGTLTISDSGIFSNGATMQGGGIYNNSAMLTLTDSTISGNSAQFGGGIENNGGTVMIDGSTFNGNSVMALGAGLGGAIENQGGDLTIDNSHFELNLANQGGAILNSGTLTVTGSTFTANFATDSGGAIDSGPLGTVMLTGSSLTSNSTTGFGGAIASDGMLSLMNSLLSGNSAGALGGGIDNSGTLTVQNSTIVRNTADAGGGVFSDSMLTVINSSVSSNMAFAEGGGIWAFDGNVTVLASFISQNTGGSDGILGGGGIALSQSVDGIISSSTIADNLTGGTGGGIDNRGTVSISNSTISRNSAVEDGGGVFAEATSNFSIFNSTITGNLANATVSGTCSGGGISAEAGTVELVSTIVAGNFVTMALAPDDISGTIAAAENSLIGDANTSGGIVHGQDQNIVGNNGVGVLDINAVLDTTLKNNGGPTLTHDLVQGSPAIDAGSNFEGPAFDQRGPGFLREVGGQADIGAIERQTRTLIISDDLDVNANVLVNGGFETGDFTGWTVTTTGSGDWTINDGTLDPAGPATPLPPISGSFDAVTEQSGLGVRTLSQTFAVPTTINSATLQFSDRIQNFALDFQDPSQEFRVLLRDAMGTVIEEVFSTNPGDPNIQIGPNVRTFDVTSALQSLVGQIAELVFVEEDSLFFFNVTLDDVILVFDANFTTVQQAIDTASPGDTIIITGGEDGILTEQGITIDKDLTIQGAAGPPQVIVQAAENPGEATERVFEVVEDVTVTIDNLTIRHGVDLSGGGGGGILNAGVLTLNSSNLLQNSTTQAGGGIKNNQGVLAIMGSTLAQNTAQSRPGVPLSNFGGGVANVNGSLTVANSTLSQNTAGGGWLGGGIATTGGTVTNLNTTVTGNISGGLGGGIWFTSNTLLTLQSTIVAGNFMDVGVASQTGSFLETIEGDVVAGDVLSSHETTRTPSDVVATPANGRLDIQDDSATPTDARNNLIGDAASSGGIEDGVNGNIVGQKGAGTIPIDRILDVLLKNNGGVTLTHALVKGSPAIDAGINPNNFEFDQRGEGFPRVIRRSADIGAFESIFLAPAFEPAVAFGSGGRIQAEVVVSNLFLDQVFSLLPYDGFLGGVRVAIGDVNGDGVNDLITAPGPGGGPHIKVFEGETGRELASFMAYDPRFLGGVFVAAADVGGGPDGMPDGFADIITGADAGGGPHVKVFSGRNGALLVEFFAFDVRFRGGVRVAAGDINNDGTPDVITGAGPGGGPHVRVFGGTTGQILPGQDFFAFAPNYTGGVFVAANNTGGGQPGLIVVSSGASLHTGARVALFNRPGGNATFDLPTSAGARVAVLDFNQDGINDYLVSTGPGASGLVQLIDGNPGDPPLPPFDNGEPFGPTILSFFPFGTLYQDGIFVAGSI